MNSASFRNLKKLKVEILSTKYNEKLLTGLYLETDSNSAYYVKGRLCDFKDLLGNNLTKVKKDELRFLFNKKSNKANNWFVLEYFHIELPGIFVSMLSPNNRNDKF